MQPELRWPPCAKFSTKPRTNAFLTAISWRPRRPPMPSSVANGNQVRHRNLGAADVVLLGSRPLPRYTALTCEFWASIVAESRPRAGSRDGGPRLRRIGSRRILAAHQQVSRRRLRARRKTAGAAHGDAAFGTLGAAGTDGRFRRAGHCHLPSASGGNAQPATPRNPMKSNPHLFFGII